MKKKYLHGVTGAFGYSGKYIAEELLSRDKQVITLTNSVNRPNPFGYDVRAFPFNFDKKEELIESLQKVKVLYNTYWVRFNHKTFKHSTAIDNTLTLFEAAKKAGVERIVHVSITNATKETHLEYFQGKGILEQALINSGLSYSILRPTVIFGHEDILINNIAWMIRHMPVMGVFGDGKYRLQPIYVKDLAKLAVEQGENTEDKIVDAIGPETFEYKQLIETIAEILGIKRRIISVSDNFGYFVGKIVGIFKNDYLITKEEIKGLKSDLLFTNSQPAGNVKLTDWIKENKDILGKKYSNELKRRKEIEKTYMELKK
jgi:nucleoside-diphosphate-sugar epimerase